MKKLNILVIVAYASLVVAIMSAFTTILSYTNSAGVHRTFSLLDFFADASALGNFVFTEYTGKIYVQYQSTLLFILIALGVFAVVCAFIGLWRLSRQTDNVLSFVLTILGLIGTMAPSLVIFICIIALKDSYLGTISCGLYPIIAPIAMLVCIVTAAQIRIRNVKYRRKLKAAEGVIFKGGDL